MEGRTGNVVGVNLRRSPLGKLYRQSQPYAPGGSDAWTTYTYDASGRTLSVALPDNSTTSYQYQGNTVKVTDPAGNRH